MRAALIMVGAGEALLLKKSGGLSHNKEETKHKISKADLKKRAQMVAQAGEGAGFACAQEILDAKDLCPDVAKPPGKEDDNMENLHYFLHQHENTGKLSNHKICEEFFNEDGGSCQGKKEGDPLATDQMEPAEPKEQPAEEEETPNAFLQSEESAPTLKCGPYDAVPVSSQDTLKEFLEARDALCEHNDEQKAFACYKAVVEAICEAEEPTPAELEEKEEAQPEEVKEGEGEAGFLQRSEEPAGDTDSSEFTAVIKGAHKIGKEKCQHIDDMQECSGYTGGSKDRIWSTVPVATKTEEGEEHTVQCKGKSYTIAEKTQIGKIMKTYENDCGFPTSRKSRGGSSSR